MKKNKRIISKLAILIGLLIGYYFLNAVFKISIPCMFYKITGFHCPGCGITRLLFSLIKLDFYQAFRYNPLIFILLTIFVLKMIQCIITKRKLKYKIRRRLCAWLNKAREYGFDCCGG